MTTTKTRDVRPEEWTSFLDAFSRQYRGQPMTVELLGKDLGVHVVARQLPLMGITAESRPGGKRVIEVIVGDSPDAHVTHVIQSPVHVRVKQVGNGEDTALQIESLAGPTVLVDFQSRGFTS